jgi:folate-binding protein YgfZ
MQDYQTIREAAAIGAVAPRRQLAVSGPDRKTFLQGLLTNDIQALQPGTGCYAAWLSPQGRMLTDMDVLELDATILLDLPAETADATLQRLNQCLFSEDVRLESLADRLTGVWVHGPGAAAVLETVLQDAHGLATWDEYRHRACKFEMEPASVVRIDQLGVPGYCVYLTRDGETTLVEALTRAGAVLVSREALEAARIEAGYPVFGIDMTGDTIPLEAGIEQRAISFTKGCYVGQEVVIRILHRGHGRVARRLVKLRPARSVARAARLHAGDREIGFVTSAAESPRLGPVALGYVHRDFAAPGTMVEVETGTGRVLARVSA